VCSSDLRGRLVGEIGQPDLDADVLARMANLEAAAA
jgi:hypothetical protein